MECSKGVREGRARRARDKGLPPWSDKKEWSPILISIVRLNSLPVCCGRLHFAHEYIHRTVMGKKYISAGKTWVRVLPFCKTPRPAVLCCPLCCPLLSLARQTDTEHTQGPALPVHTIAGRSTCETQTFTPSLFFSFLTLRPVCVTFEVGPSEQTSPWTFHAPKKKARGAE